MFFDSGFLRHFQVSDERFCGKARRLCLFLLVDSCSGAISTSQTVLKLPMSKFSNRMRAIGIAVAAIGGASQRSAPATYLLPSGRTASVKSPTGWGPGPGSSCFGEFRSTVEKRKDHQIGKDGEAPVRDSVQAIAVVPALLGVDRLIRTARRESKESPRAHHEREDGEEEPFGPPRVLSGDLQQGQRYAESLERETLVLYGELADLDRGGECWVIESFIGCPCSEVAGYIDPKTGQLMSVWIMPEG